MPGRACQMLVAALSLLAAASCAQTQQLQQQDSQLELQQSSSSYSPGIEASCSSLERAAGLPCSVDDENGGHAQALQKRQDPPQQASSTSIRIPQTAANGGITMLTPAATAQATFYKIARDNFITFGWNYTDVLVQPTSITIQAYCSQNSYTYPVGPTQGLPGDTTSYAWNPYDYEQGSGATPLAEASYTLRIFRENGYAAAPSAGYMKSYAGTIFALYRPQPYTALADGWTCAACSAAVRMTGIHPAVIATTAAVLFGSLTVYLRIA